MFNSTDPSQTLLSARLSRITPKLRSLGYSTKEDYQAEVYSEVNGVLTLGNNMQPMYPIAAEGPATVGDITTNVNRLNEDTGDIASEILAVESTAAHLYNLAATSQNQIRQSIREAIYVNGSTKYIEAFINRNNISSATTCNIDVNAGIATLPIIKTQVLSPTITIGVNSIGTTGTPISNLTDGLPYTIMTWNGPTLELLITFDTPQVVNRLVLAQDTYAALEITTLATSPDGTLYEDVLLDLGQTSIQIDSTSGKYSGDFLLDFPPRHVSSMLLVIQDLTGIGVISLRDMTLIQNTYSSSGIIASNPIYTPKDTINFSTTQLSWDPLVSITHQISYNNNNFTTITPGAISLISTPFWYRGILIRKASAFSSSSQPINTQTLDPSNTTNFALRSSSSVPMGDGTSQRILVFSSITGPVLLREVPLLNTLSIQVGAIYLDATQYTFANQTLSFSSPQTNVTVTYQTTALGSTALTDRQNYYTSLLFQVQFQASNV
jgi:hypothetical protein